MFGKGPLKVKTFDRGEMQNVLGQRDGHVTSSGHNGLSSGVTYTLIRGTKIEKLNRRSLGGWFRRLFIPKVGSSKTKFFLGR
jgi:hypothetical protein